MGLKEQMMGILRSSDTQRIKFTFSGSTGLSISINGDSFTQVADALKADKISVVEGGAKDGMAKYSAFDDIPHMQSANTFYIGKMDRSSRDFDALIIHESVHAAFDLNKMTLPWLDNEVAAYIAQGSYLRNTGFPKKRIDPGAVRDGWEIIDSIIAKGEIDTWWLKELHGTLKSDPVYHDYIRGTFVGDG